MIATIRPAEIVPEVVPMTVAALRLLDEQNFFVNDNNRHELIEGVLVMVPPPSTSHQFSESRVLKALMKSLMSAGLMDQYRVQTGGGFIIDQHTHLGPDVMVTRELDQARDWLASDIVIMIEIAGSSLTGDLGEKARLYARAGIAEYWVLDVADKALIIHRAPSPNHFGEVKTLRGPDQVTALLEPKLVIAVGDLF